MLKLRSSGRGRRYSRLRGAVESGLSLAYTGGWPAWAWSRLPGATRIEVVRHALPLLRPGARPLRLAFVSDIHFGPTTPLTLIDNAFAALAEARPDVLLLGGDYVFLEATRDKLAALGERVAAVPAALKLAVLGNHDLWTDDVAVARCLTQAGARVLVNEAFALAPEMAALTVVGLDDPFAGTPDPQRAFAGVSGAAPVLVLCHAPEGVPHAAGRGVSLLVCGHTHGGQIALPSGPLVVHGRYGRQYPSGLHPVEDFHLYVSRGVGVVEVPLRLFAPSEIAVFDLTAGPAAAPSPGDRPVAPQPPFSPARGPTRS